MITQRIRVGDYDCWALPDGDLIYPGSMLLPPEGNLPSEVLVPYTALLVDTGAAKVLVDTGAGALGPATGKLIGNLAASGFAPEDVDVVVLSHAHPDHIGDLSHFRNAVVTMTTAEFSFWMAGETDARLRANELYGIGALEHLMADSIRDHLAPAKDRIELIDGPTEVASGVLLFPAAGHTPGHAAVLVSSGRQQLLYVGDALIHPAQFENPAWISAFDLAPTQTVETRKALLDRAVADRCMLAAFHLPGAVGFAERRQSSYRWQPLCGVGTV
ncbi:MAG TPA: MBL fold metallo-hydrolase [Bryobacteraceae bacterium]|nr:MBL fold metallo-hydrolase [Bryobacteraceae bacterium]